jgi:hypothetical protein
MGKGPVLFDGITGDLYVNVKGVFSGGGGTSSLFGAAFPASGTALGFESAGGLMVPLVLTAGGEVPVSGTFGGTADETVFAAGVTEGSPLMGYDPTSGELLVAQLSAGTRILEVAGTFSSTPPTSATSSVPGQTTVGVTAGTILALNAARKACAVQNTGTTVIYLALGHTPTVTAYFIALPAGGVANDGSSNRWDGTVSGVLWTGAVSAISSASGGTCVVTELT